MCNTSIYLSLGLNTMMWGWHLEIDKPYEGDSTHLWNDLLDHQNTCEGVQFFLKATLYLVPNLVSNDRRLIGPIVIMEDRLWSTPR